MSDAVPRPTSPPVPDAAPPGTVFVVGAGIMGSGIAAQCALAGHPVTIEDLSPELADRGAANARRAIDRAVGRGMFAPGVRDAAVARIDAAVGFSRAAEAEIVVEAAPEDLGLKRRLFGELEAATRPATVLASNTSSLPIAAIGSELRDPGRLVGVHFFNPVLQMRLVELIPGERTRPEVVARAERFARGLGKTVVRSRDTPGFVTTRALAVLVNEAARMLEEGVASREDIDTAYKLGFHHPMGPFELVDLVGIDTAVAILDVLWDGFGDPRYHACPLLRTMVAEKKLGRKTGEGFYSYPPRPADAR